MTLPGMTFPVNTLAVRQFLNQQAKLENLKTSEIGYAVNILKQLDYSKEYSDTQQFFAWLRSKNLVTHRTYALFAVRVFEHAGASYSKIKI